MRDMTKFLFGIVVLITTSLATSNTWADSQWKVTLPPRSQQTCGELQLVFLVDQSLSMSAPVQGVSASDPYGFRFSGPAAAVEMLSSLRYQAYSASTIRVSLAQFGDRPRLVMPWTILNATTEAEHQELMTELAPFFEPTNHLGNTNVLKAFQSVSSLFDQAPPQTEGCPTRIIVVITDGKPSLLSPDFEWTEHMAEVYDYVHQYLPPPGHQIYVLGIDSANTYWSEVQPYWNKITADPSTVVRVENAEQMTGLLLEIVTTAAGSLTPSGARAEVECITSSRLPIPPFLQEIKVTLIKSSPHLHLHVLDGSGLELEPSRADVKVSLKGKDEPIETLTVANPPPGIWTLETEMPSDTQAHCLVQVTSVSSEGYIAHPVENTEVPQFSPVPVVFAMVDASGKMLPSYANSAYSLQVQADLTGPTGTTQSTPMQSSPAGEHHGEVIPLEPGPNVLHVTARAYNPGDGEIMVVDEITETIQVQPVHLAMIAGPPNGTVVEQNSEVPLELAVVSEQDQPIEPTLPTVVSATLIYEEQAIPLTLLADQNGIYRTSFLPTHPGQYVLNYGAIIHSAFGDIMLGSEQIAFVVRPATLLRPVILTPSDYHFVATDPFLRPVSLTVEVQLVDNEGGKATRAQIGVPELASLLDIRVRAMDDDGWTTTLKLAETDRPDVFRAIGDTVGPGRYQITMSPATTLQSGFTWAAESWSETLYGDVNPLFYSLMAVGLIVLGIGVLLLWREMKARQHPLTGYIEVFQEVPDMDNATYRKIILRRSLPRRNRVSFRVSSGMIKRVIVECLTNEDSRKGRTLARVILASGARFEVLLDPSHPATPLQSGYFILKGPRRTGTAKDDAYFWYEEPSHRGR